MKGSVLMALQSTKKSLSEVRPDLAKQWHPTKNSNLKPSDVTCGSKQKVWWICQHGHAWEATINSRMQGCGCPYCSGRVAITGVNDLQTVNPRLAKEWHPIKNNGLTPSDVLPNSGKKVWWICDKGHEWQSKISHRSKGNGCPYCCNQKILIGFNDLATTHPNIAKEWHPTLNGQLKPTDVPSGSSKMVWWICDKGHEWQSKISHRSDGHGCPYCAGQRTIKGINDLKTINPNIAQEWNYAKNGRLTPSDVMPNSGKKVWWVCDKGHEYQATVGARSQGGGCPYCSNKKVLMGYNDLQTTHPALAAQWHPTKNGELKPTDVTAGSNKKLWWICDKGHEWQTSAANRIRYGTNCPTCSQGRRTSFPELAIYFYVHKFFPNAIHGYRTSWLKNMELDIFIPTLNIAIEYDGQRWHKNQKRDVQKRILCEQHMINLIRVREPKCPIIDGMCINMNSCSRKDVERAIQLLLKQYLNIEQPIDVNLNRDMTAIQNLISYQDISDSLLSKYPHLSQEWHPTKNGNLKPEHVSPCSGKIVWWKCERGHEWQAAIHSRSRGSNCPYCSNRKVLVGYNDLTTTQPELAAQWNFDLNGTLLPTHVTQCSHKKVWWKCDCGHIWMASVSKRSSGCSCPSCAAKHRGRSRRNVMAVKRVGEMRMMSCGLNAKIITYSGYKNINVQFENGIKKQTSYDSFKKGTVSLN